MAVSLVQVTAAAWWAPGGGWSAGRAKLITAEAQPPSWGFVGRDQELAALLTLLDPLPEAGAVVSVVAGMAGVGKTALAWQAARTAVGRGWFPGGAVIVDLHGDAQVAPEEVYASLLRALDPDLPAIIDEPASAYHHLMSRLEQVSRPVLLVVDNADNTDQITALLPTGRAHRVLVTSRHPLEELARRTAAGGWRTITRARRHVAGQPPSRRPPAGRKPGGGPLVRVSAIGVTDHRGAAGRRPLPPDHQTGRRAGRGDHPTAELALRAVGGTRRGRACQP
ncbi:MAG: ATP-binding protein [Pseudonocardiaceae bacterium]